MTRAYKFLRADATAPFSGVPWPRPDNGAPGTWIDARGVEPCHRAVHGCAPDDLPYWIQEELWEIELDGDVRRVGHKLAARRGRLVRRIEAWNTEASRAFSLACAARAAAYAAVTPKVAGHAADAAAFAAAGNAAVAGFIASRAAELSGGTGSYDAERSAQVAWLSDHLGLEAVH